MSGHVPAWKKIGLKLKYAKETADDAPIAPATASTENGFSHAGAKRSRDEEIEQDQAPTKKHKKHSKDRTEASIEPRTVKGILSGSQSPTKTPNNKKSVQFSAETKEEDGQTGQDYFKAWAAGGQPHTPPKPSTETSIPETPESTEKSTPKPQESPAETKAKVKASKRDKKVDQAAAQTQDQDVEGQPSLQERRESKAAKKAEKQARKAQTQVQQPAHAPTSAYVEYLHQFQHDKAHWKFNKSKENHLLKSVWSMYRVPSSYTDALVSYIAGLQGAGARSRLVEGADEVLREVTEKGGQKYDFNGYEEPETRRASYISVLHKQKEHDATPNLEQDDFDRASRAEAVLEQLLNHAPVPVAKPTTVTSAGGAKRIQFADEDLPAPAPAPVKQQPARRKRKARTDVSSDESSSDSSSSDSDSDSSDGDSDSD
ncbi:hypothetical protein Q7P37_011161 [Cladosporium fusiforme]